MKSKFFIILFAMFILVGFYSGAGAADAGTIADHDSLSMANPLGKIAFRSTRFNGVDVFPCLASITCMVDGGLLLEKLAVRTGIFGDHIGHLRDDVGHGLILFGELPQNIN